VFEGEEEEMEGREKEEEMEEEVQVMIGQVALGIGRGGDKKENNGKDLTPTKVTITEMEIILEMVVVMKVITKNFGDGFKIRDLTTIHMKNSKNTLFSKTMKKMQTFTMWWQIVKMDCHYVYFLPTNIQL
jgi:hypothetical protein